MDTPTLPHSHIAKHPFGTPTLTFDDRGLLPAVVQDAATGEVLMVAWMNAEALRRTRETGEAWFWSRSRAELWHKGATSGHTMRVREIRVDCDGDALLLKVNPAGPACHTGERSCFYRSLPLSGNSRSAPSEASEYPTGEGPGKGATE